LVSFIHHLPHYAQTSQAKREVIVVKRILIICGILGFSGSPTTVFLFQYIITGRLHPMADRIHELGLAININIVTLGFAFLNSLINHLSTTSMIQTKTKTENKRLKAVLNTQYIELHRLKSFNCVCHSTSY
jgi:hypothetical protein